MSDHVAVAVSLCVAVHSGTVWASCKTERFTEKSSFSELPAEIRQLLEADIHGGDEIADRGEKFNATDVVNPNIPNRRLARAFVSSSCVLVAVERGGRGYSVELAAFDHHGDSWQRFASRTTLEVPATAIEFSGLLRQQR